MGLKITILIDNPNSWMNSYITEFIEKLKNDGHSIRFCNNSEDISEGDVAVFLSCENIIDPKTRAKNKYNLVVHESDLPRGKGWSPLTWQILEGKNEIPITLFEAVDKVDSGPVYSKDKINFQGHELIGEMRDKQAEKTFELILKFIENYPKIESRTQTGEETFYKKRTSKDSELDVNKTIKEQFNLLRVVDNERYPAFFHISGKKYILKVYKEGKDE